MTELIDLGTTTIAIELFDVSNPKSGLVTITDNPQRKYGTDVVARMDAQMKGNGDVLSRVVWDAVMEQTERLCARSGVDVEDVSRVIVGGNTTMIHLLLGYDCTPLSRAPFVPEVDSPEHFTKNGADVEIVPWASAFIGGDIVAGLYAVDELLKSSHIKNYMLIDLGTNGEMVLSRDGELFATATAAGPAFEGSGLSCGVAGIPGAISSVKLNSLRASLTTIENALPIGLCGSGAVSMVSELIRNGYVNDDASLAETFPEDGYVLSPHSAIGDKRPIIFTADDLHQILLAKAAIAAGIDTLLKASSLTSSDIDRVFLAGGFGYHMDIEAADRIGLFSSLSPDIITPIGNSCLTGLERIDSECFSDSNDESFLRKIDVPEMHTINLGTSEFFKKKYVEHLYLNNQLTKN